MPTMNDLVSFLRSLPQGRLQRTDILCDKTLIAREDNLSVYFVPFGHFPENAQIALIGITPGFEQMRLAFEAARDLHETAVDELDLYRICGAAAGFGGPMRKILVGMLDEIGIHEAMSLHTSAELFDADQTDVLRASVLQHPVFVKGGNYTGYQPPVERSEFMMNMVHEFFVPGIRRAPGALLVPMGKCVEAVLRRLELPNLMLAGFPHPSPANGHHQRQMNQHRDELRQIVCSWRDRPH